MRIHLWGTDYRRGKPELRKQLYLPQEERGEFLRDLLSVGFTDVVYLATCNRIEFYTTAKDPFFDTRPLWKKLLQKRGLASEAFFEGYHVEGKAALRHLLRVASSLESLVIGEPQILGQLKDAVHWSKIAGLPVSPSLDRCFQLAFETAKRVRSETSIAERPVSVASLGIEHLLRLESENPLQRAVVVGRSPISVLVIQWLKKNRPACPIVWVNRDIEKLKVFSESDHCELVSLKDFLNYPPSFTHLFTATASPDPVFTGEFWRKIESGRKMVLDFAEPSDVSDCDSIRDLSIVQLSDLREEARQNAEARSRGVEEAERVIEEALRGYFLQQKEAPILKDYNTVEPTFIDELERAWELIKSDFPEELHPRLRKWAEALVRRNIHLSREHLRSILRRVSEPAEYSSVS